jgi:hypothetical protein
MRVAVGDPSSPSNGSGHRPTGDVTETVASKSRRRDEATIQTTIGTQSAQFPLRLSK